MANIVLGIDPGVNHCGWAQLTPRGLVRCGLWRLETMLLPDRCYQYYCHARSTPADLVVVEYPQVYQSRQQKGRQKDIVDLAAIAGALIAGAKSQRIEVLIPTPAERKGNIPKEVEHARVLRALNLTESNVKKMARVPQHLLHNVLDAVCLAWWGAEKVRRREQRA